MKDSLLDRVITHPKRGWIVTTVTMVSGALFLLPAVESFNAVRSKRDDLKAELTDAQQQVSRLPVWKQHLDDKRETATQLEAKAFDGSRDGKFRSQIVELVRQSGCTMRRIHLGDDRYREWLGTGDDPLEDRPPSRAKGETPYYLETQQLTVSVEGNLTSAQQLLSQVLATDRLMHAASVSIRHADSGFGNVSLDLELLLFNLVLKSTVDT